MPVQKVFRNPISFFRNLFEKEGGFVDVARVNTKPYSIATSIEKIINIPKIRVPKGWAPNLSVPLDNALPFAWPEKYIALNHSFNPFCFYSNAISLRNYYLATKDSKTLELMKKLFQRFLEYSEVHDGARFVMYRFRKNYRKIPVAVPWTSAYASGAALIGLNVTHECIPTIGADKIAKEILAGMGQVIDPRKHRPRFWVSFVDPKNYLWFEEKPLDQAEQPRILNGHIRALTGLYVHWFYNRDEHSQLLLRAGIATMEKYAPEYRVAGSINAYDLMKPVWVDYGPERTVDQQNILYEMTGEDVFRRYRDMFAEDIAKE